MPGVVQQFRGARRRHRNFFGRLQDEGVSAGDGEREHPHRHHRREIERRDARANAQRLADGLLNRCRARRFRANRPSSGWACRRRPPPSGSRGAPSLRVVERLAVFGGENARDVVGVLFEQRLVAIEHLHAIDHRHFAPFQKRLMREPRDAIDFGRRSRRAPARSLRRWRDW